MKPVKVNLCILELFKNQQKFGQIQRRENREKYFSFCHVFRLSFKRLVTILKEHCFIISNAGLLPKSFCVSTEFQASRNVTTCGGRKETGPYR